MKLKLMGYFLVIFSFLLLLYQMLGLSSTRQGNNEVDQLASQNNLRVGKDMEKQLQNNNINNNNNAGLDPEIAGRIAKAAVALNANIEEVPQETESGIWKEHEIELKIDHKSLGPLVNTALSEIKTSMLEAPEGPISEYLKKHDIPIVILAHNRPSHLRKTINSLLQVRGVKRQNIIVVQDGTTSDIHDVTLEFQIELKQKAKLEPPETISGDDMKSYHISNHYKYAISYVFASRPNVPALIVVEDDLLFSPDFYEFFECMSPALQKDPSLFMLQAWNDNGFTGRVIEERGLHRTNYFSNLAFLLSRRTYKGELEENWPVVHWNEWIRSPEVLKGREILYPEISRVFHSAKKGTFMDKKTHKRYFKNIVYNKDKRFRWEREESTLPAYVGVLQPVYEAKVQTLIQNGLHVSTFDELEEFSREILIVWVSYDPESSAEFDLIGRYFQIWHDSRRGKHNGLHQFFWANGNYVILINVDESPYTTDKPAHIEPFHYTSFDRTPPEEIKGVGAKHID